MLKPLLVGIDVGSTTVKLVATEGDGKIAYGRYERHRSDVRAALAGLLEDASRELGARASEVSVAVTGSAGIGEAERLGLPFVQEVMACASAVEELLPEADVAIELGGEDAKITYYGVRLEQRMNGSCAVGTGSFIDQMAVLLGTDPGGLDELASRALTIYPIAARCGVFAKADVQPLVNEGARREDVAASVFQPFACLPNHVTGKGMLKELRRRYPRIPVSAVDFDPGASEVNQLNRVKLLMASAKRCHGLLKGADGPSRAGSTQGGSLVAREQAYELEVAL